MTTLAIDRAVAAAAGEPPSATGRPGLGPEDAPVAEHGTPAPAIDCPLRGRPAACPGRGGRGEAAMAECDRCDVSFDLADGGPCVAEAVPANGELAA